MTSFINDSGTVLDYSGDDFAITKQVASWIDFKIKGDFSIDFSLPNTAINRKALNYYGAQGEVPVPGTWNIIRDGNRIARGEMIVRSSEKDKITCYFISGNSNWFNALSFNLREIDFPDRFTISATDMNTQKSATEGLIFPVVDWWAENKHRSTVFFQNNNDRQNGFPNFTEWHPCLYLSTLVNEMCNFGGVKIDGDLIKDPLFKKIIITPDGPDYFWPDWEVNRSRVKCFLQNASNSYNDASDPQPVQWGSVEQGGSLFNQSNYSILIGKTGTYRVSQNMYCGTVGISFTQALYVNGVNVMSLPAFGNSLNYEFIYNFNKGDYVQIYVDRAVGSGSYRLNRATPANESNITLELLKPVGTYIQADYISSFTSVTVKIPPGAIVPDMTAIDLVKFLCIYFGCVCTYNEYSKTLTINKMSRFQKENAEDWSEYYVTHKTTYQNTALHNYIRFEETEEKGIADYNSSVKKGYGGGDIQTSNEAVYERDIYKLPFGPSYDEETTTKQVWFFPYIKFYELEFVEEVPYSGIVSYADTSGASLIKLTSTFSQGINQQASVFFVKSNSGEYHGFHALRTSDTAVTNPVLGTVYGSNDTGTVAMYSLKKVQSVPRLLIVLPGNAVSDAGGANFYIQSNWTIGSSQMTAALGWFDKPRMDIPIDIYKDSLAIDNVGVRTYNNTVGERYHNFLENVYNNPKIDATFLLPGKVFEAFRFGFVYLKTKELTGYFFVQSIADYVEPTKPVKVELLYID